MKIWEYLQSERNKNIVVMCPDRNEAEKTKKEIYDTVKRHTLLNRRHEITFTYTNVYYRTNKLFCVSYAMSEIALRGTSVNVMLLSESLTRWQKIVITERFTAHLVPNAIVASYRRKI
jgi:hypothetical protein